MLSFVFFSFFSFFHRQIYIKKKKSSYLNLSNKGNVVANVIVDNLDEALRHCTQQKGRILLAITYSTRGVA